MLLYSLDPQTQSLISIVNNTFLFPFSCSFSIDEYINNVIHITQNYNKYKESFVDETIVLAKLIEIRTDVYREWLSLFNNIFGNTKIDKFIFLPYDLYGVDVTDIIDENNMKKLEKAMQVIPTNINYLHTYLLTLDKEINALVESYNQLKIYPKTKEFKMAVSIVLNGKSRVYFILDDLLLVFIQSLFSNTTNSFVES